MIRLFSNQILVVINKNKYLHQWTKSGHNIGHPCTIRRKMSSSKFANKMIDIGANLTDPMFRGIYHGSKKHRDDFEDMMQRSCKHGVDKMIITGGSLGDSKQALEIAKQHANLYSTVGCHPTRCNEFKDHPDGPEMYLKQLEALAHSDRDKVVAIGELGLDYDRLHFCDAETQRSYFEMQLELASRLKLPLFLHNRNSIADLICLYPA